MQQMDDVRTVWVLWSHTEGEMPRIESVHNLHQVGEMQRTILQGIWKGMKRFELEEHPLI